MKVRGVELALHPEGDYVSDVIRETGDFFEAVILDEIAARLAVVGPGILVDVGAHIGNHAAFFSAFVPNDGIYAFEPLPANARLLRRNASPFGTMVYETALSDFEGMGTMSADPVNLGHSAIGPGGIAVRVRTLDSYSLPHVTLLKVDVEGHERDVLAGARKTIAESRPLILLEDWHGPGHAQELLPGYELAVEWERVHQTFLYAPA